jgi:Amt family ammonium transporter
VTMGGQLYIQAVAVLATIVYDAVVSFVLLKIIDAVVGLRVNADEETEGLDVVLHDERAYDI